MTHPTLAGTYTALITPFAADGAIDYDALEKLIELQCAANVEGILILGTTGESPTVTHEEFEKMVPFAKKKIAGRSRLVVGTGSNDTAKTVSLSKEAETLGADVLLVVNPYYNKPTQEGLYQHFSAVAEAVDVPIILYNIKGRTAINVETETLMRIVADNSNVAAVKEASGDFDQMKNVIARAPEGFAILSGDDNMTNDLIAAGGHGVVSVLSNLLPADIKAMVDLGLAGKFDDAKAAHEKLLPLMKGCFIETNPLPIKTALVLKGIVQEIFRLPMCPMSPENRAKWQEILEEQSVLQKKAVLSA